jgi:hypothetical protein
MAEDPPFFGERPMLQPDNKHADPTVRIIVRRR